jgi:signal transduction histidine kinase
VVIFGETTREIAAPILAGDGFYGVLDIISTSKRRFGPIGKPVAKLLGRQIGLYHHLALKIHEIRQLERDSAERVEKERKTYENFEHQLRTPVMKAKRRATELVRDYSARRQLDPRLAILQSLCNQADRVTRNLRFFVQLAEERPIALPADSLETLTAPRLVGYLKEAAVDQSRQVPSRRRLEFTVDEKFIDDLHRVTVQANWDLLEQAIGNLLDNAGKYSYVGTRVRLSGGLTHKGESFYISVANQGYPLREPKRLAVRGYRGDEAQGSEGSGIGLWIVKNIMLAHKGSLEIIPTTSQGVNDFRLVFPKLKTGAA